MPISVGSSNNPQRGQRRRRNSFGVEEAVEVHIAPSDVDASLSTTRPGESGSGSTFSTLARHRVTRRRDHDPLGMRIEDTLRELDEQNNVLSSVLEEPLPSIVDRGEDEFHLHLTDGSGEILRRPKRRKIDGDSLQKPIPKYAYSGRTVPGKLMMRIESCDSGAYGCSLKTGHHGSRVEDVLYGNNLVFSTESARCNLVLSHEGDTPFSITKLVIKSPLKGYEARLQEGLVFVTMDKRGLIYRTERYDMHSDLERRKKVKRTHSQTQRPHYPSAQSVRLDQTTLQVPEASSNRRNSWQQADNTTLINPSRISASTQTEDMGNEPPSSPQSPYSPLYLDFNVRSTSDLEEVGQESLQDQCPHESEDVYRREYLDDLFNRITMTSRGFDNQRAMFQQTQRTPMEDGNSEQAANTDSSSTSSYLSSPSGSDDEQNNDNQLFMTQRESGPTQGAWSPPTRSHVPDNSTMDAMLRHRLLRSYRVWRHGARRKLLSEPRQIEWVPNKIKREGLGEGPSGMPESQLSGDKSNDNRSRAFALSYPLRPHARFFISKEDQGVTVNFDPPVAGHYVLIKMWAPPGMASIDVQEVAAYGFAGPRLLPKIEFM